jgi:predicted nucleotidyltransferase
MLDISKGVSMVNYLSVTEYAKRNGKDSGNVRRLLALGRLEGQKVGNQWIIPEDAIYPEDKREKTGEYRNWRNRVKLNRHKALMKTISGMVLDFQGIYGSSLAEVVLYGSYARGTQTEESDVDIALIFQKAPSKDVTDKMVDCVASCELECGKVLSVIDLDYKKFNLWKDTLPFYKNICKEGIVLWKAK